MIFILSAKSWINSLVIEWPANSMKKSPPQEPYAGLSRRLLTDPRFRQSFSLPMNRNSFVAVIQWLMQNTVQGFNARNFVRGILSPGERAGVRESVNFNQSVHPDSACVSPIWIRGSMRECFSRNSLPKGKDEGEARLMPQRPLILAWTARNCSALMKPALNRKSQIANRK